MLFLFSILATSSSFITTPIPTFLSPPSSQVRSSAIYDPEGSQIITIGGFDSTNTKSLNLIVSFNLTSKKFSKITPVSKFDFGVVSGHEIFLRKDRKIISLGYNAGCYSFNLHSREWKIEEVSGEPFPLVTDFGAARFEKNGKNYVAVYGGIYFDQISSDLFLFDLDTFTNEKIQQFGNFPKKRASLSLSFYNDSLYLFGDDDTYKKNRNDLFKFDLNTNTWEILITSGEAPGSRYTHKAHVFGDFLFIFFGISLQGQVYDDVFRFSFLDYKWEKLGNFPEVGRYNIQSVLIQNKVYILYGRHLTNLFNDIIEFEILGNNVSLTRVTYDFKVPSERRYHCGYLMNQFMYVFGGEIYNYDGVLTTFSDMWKFDLEKAVWQEVTTNGDPPSVRTNFASTSVISYSIAIFGGKNEKNYLNDLYFFYEPLETWIVIQANGALPTPRSNSCMVYHLLKFYIIGGKNSIEGFNEIWKYSYELNEYHQLKKNPSIFDQDIHDCNTYIDNLSNDISLIVLGGQNFYSFPNQNFYNITIKDSNQITNVTSIKMPLIGKAKSTITRFQDKILVIGGFSIDYVVVDPLILIDLSTLTSEVIEFESEDEIQSKSMLNIYGHSAVYYKNSIFIFGGSGSTDFIRSFYRTNNNLLNLTFTSTDKISLPCSPGTHGKECKACQEGTFYSEGNCVKCRKGTFSNKKALQNNRQCIPCGYGYYSDIEGQSQCKQCPTSSECLTGSSRIDSSFKIPANETHQPGQFESNAFLIDIVIEILWILVIIFVSLFIVSICGFTRFREYMKKFDLYINSHDQKLEVPVVYRKTITGGLFSLVFYMVAVVTIVIACLVQGFDNIYELRAMVPSITLDQTIISDSLKLNFTLHIYGDQCKNSTNIENMIFLLEEGFDYSSRSMSTELLDQNCQVTFTYKDFKLTSKKSEILLQMKETLSYASALTCTISSSSSIPEEISSARTSITPSSKLLTFRGVTPSEFYFKFVPSVFTQETISQSISSTGFHVLKNQEPVLGGLQTKEFLFSQIHVYVKVVIVESETAMEIKRLEKQTIFTFFGALMGSIFGLMGTFGAGMSVVEGFVDRYSKCSVEKENARRCLSRSRKMESEFGNFKDDYKIGKVFPLDTNWKVLVVSSV